MKPQHFDILGALAFAYIVVFALYSLAHAGQIPFWSVIVLALVGIGGLVVDVAIVFTFFIKKK